MAKVTEETLEKLRKMREAKKKKEKIKALPKKISSADIKPPKKKNLKVEKKKPPTTGKPSAKSQAMMDKVKKEKAPKKEAPKKGKPSAKSQAMMDKLKKSKEKKETPKKQIKITDAIYESFKKPSDLKDFLKKHSDKIVLIEWDGNDWDDIQQYSMSAIENNIKRMNSKEAPKKEAPKKKAPKKEAPKKKAPKKEAPKKKGKSKTIKTLKPIERNQLAGLLVKNFKLPLNRRFYDDERIKEELQTLYQKPNNWIDNPIVKLDNKRIKDETRRILGQTDIRGFEDRGLDYEPMPFGNGVSLDDLLGRITGWDEGYYQRLLNEKYYEPNTIIRNWKDYLAFLHIKEDDFTDDNEKNRFRYIQRTGNNLNTRLNNRMKDKGIITSWKYKKDLTQPGDKAMKTFIDNYLANPPEINPNNLDGESRYKLKKKFIMEEGTNKIDVIYKNQTLKMNAKEIITFVNNISGYKNLSKGQIEKLYKLFMFEPSYILDFHNDVKAKTTLLKKLNIQEGNKLVITPSFKSNENDEDAKAISSYERDVALLKIELKKE